MKEINIKVVGKVELPVKKHKPIEEKKKIIGDVTKRPLVLTEYPKE